jgi:hypothetical protein
MRRFVTSTARSAKTQLRIMYASNDGLRLNYCAMGNSLHLDEIILNILKTNIYLRGGFLFEIIDVNKENVHEKVFFAREVNQTLKVIKRRFLG